MAKRVYLHIGAPKSGTTYLQSILWRSREALRSGGVLFPGEHRQFHTHAALDLQGLRFKGYADPAVPGAWQRLADEAAAWDGTVIVSQELLSPARPAQIDRALESLAPAEVHIVVTARDLARQVPAAWQEDLKNRNALEFGEFLAHLREPDGSHPLARGFWRMQDAVDVLARWARDIPPERVHLITIPQQRDPGILWTRFCEVTGLDADACEVSGATVNGSLGAGEANLLRRLNLALGAELPWPQYNSLVTGVIGIDVLAARNGTRIRLPGQDHAWIAERAAVMIDGLRAAGYHVVGDLDELVPEAAAAEPAAASDAEMLDAALDCLVALLTRLQDARADADALRRERADLSARLGDVTADRDRLHAEVTELREILAKSATKLFVRRLSERHRSVMRARIIYWNIVERLRR